MLKVGDKVKGFTVTEVSGTKVFGVEGELSKEVIDGLKEHFAKPEKERGFLFRPGTRIDHILDNRPMFEQMVLKVLDPVFSEDEGNDFRMDFAGGYSVWLRNSIELEGIVTRDLKKKLDRIAGKLGLDNFLEVL